MKLLQEKINYCMNSLKMCGDLKVIAILLSLQLGYSKYCYFLGWWDIRDKKLIKYNIQKVLKIFITEYILQTRV